MAYRQDGITGHYTWAEPPDTALMAQADRIAQHEPLVAFLVQRLRELLAATEAARELLGEADYYDEREVDHDFEERSAGEE